MPDWASLSRFEIRHVTLPLQRYRALDVPSQVLGHSVSGEAMLPLFASLYWCLDQHKCFCGIWLVPLSEMANGVVKWLTRRGRPAWVDERVMMHQWSSEFSFPSSHSQLAAAVMTWLVLSSAHAEAATSTPALPSAAYALLVAASRVHVGLHFPSDVAVGLLWGALSAAAYAHIVLPSLPSFVHWSATSRLCALLLPAAAAGLAVHAAYCVAERSRGSDPPEWSRNACRGRYKASAPPEGPWPFSRPFPRPFPGPFPGSLRDPSPDPSETRREDTVRLAGCRRGESSTRGACRTATTWACWACSPGWRSAAPSSTSSHSTTPARAPLPLSAPSSATAAAPPLLGGRPSDTSKTRPRRVPQAGCSPSSRGSARRRRGSRCASTPRSAF